MATITRIADERVVPSKRYQSWKSDVDLNDAGAAIAVGDVFMVQRSLGRHASNIVFTTAAGAGVEVTFNCTNVTTYPPRDPRYNDPPLSPDLSNPNTFGTATMGPIYLPDGVSWSLFGMNIETVEIKAMAGVFSIMVF